MDFDRLYADAAPEMREALRAFRSEHPLREASINETRWQYITCGQGEPAVLWLVGGLRVYDAAFSYIPLLENDFRLIVPTYPALHSMAALADGLAGLLDAEGVGQAAVLSGSFGGMLAQVFMRRHPGRAGRVVLSSTSPPLPAAAAAYHRQGQMLRWLPGPLLGRLVARQFYRIMQPPPAEGAFWRAYLHELFVQRMSKKELLSTLDCMVDYMGQGFRPDDLAEWPGQVLIIDAEDDATFDVAASGALRDLYPAAQTYTFAQAGHSPASTQKEQFFALVRSFFQSGTIPGA